MKTYNMELIDLETEQVVEVLAENVSEYVAEKTYTLLFHELDKTHYYLYARRTN
jgi:hypothetical protein